MRTTKFLFLIMLSFCLIGCGSNQGNDWPNKVDAVIAKYEIVQGPGGVVAIAQGKQILYSKAFGWANVAEEIPNHLNTVFDIASCAKQFTAASILLLEDRGLIDLNQSIQQYFPELAVSQPVPVRSLLTHTSGIHDYSEMLILARGRAQVDHFTKTEILSAIFQQPALSFSPLEDENYSNSNYVLLAELVERVTDMSFEAFVRKNLLDPLEIVPDELHFMTEPVSDSLSLASGYLARTDPNSGFVAPNDPVKQSPSTQDLALGSSGMKASATGLIKWMSHLKSLKLEDDLLIDRLLQKDTLHNGNLSTFARGLEYGSVPEGYTWVEHTGRNLFTSVMLWWPDFDLSMVVLCNTQEIWAQSLTNEFCMDIISAMPKPQTLFRQPVERKSTENSSWEPLTATEENPAAVSRIDLNKFVGKYEANAPVGNRQPPSGGVGVNEIRLIADRLVAVRYDGIELPLKPLNEKVLLLEQAQIEFHFIDLETKRPGFSFVNLAEGIKEENISYKIPELDSGELQGIAGTYQSPGLIRSIPIELIAEDDRLFMKWGAEGHSAELHYLGQDRLTAYVAQGEGAMQCNLVLDRDQNGTIKGFSYEGHRVWHLYFEKL